MSYSIKVESDTFMDYYIQKIISILILHRYFIYESKSIRNYLRIIP